MIEKIRDMKIVRRNTLDSSLDQVPLCKRNYEAIKKSKFNDEWNPHGRQYTIRGLYNFSKNNGGELIFEDNIEKDLEEYISNLSNRNPAGI